MILNSLYSVSSGLGVRPAGGRAVLRAVPRRRVRGGRRRAPRRRQLDLRRLLHQLHVCRLEWDCKLLLCYNVDFSLNLKF